ncbi:hypothetical protein Taro_034372 [Colocasia esculenta]|uniref:Uncharacterized protein n=1 Tax=Colocasia esculenta TaxID=4460 RepID=A0A843WBR5_COLES|nr:hypothetical protein [Colocasia esculenta]
MAPLLLRLAVARVLQKALPLLAVGELELKVDLSLIGVDSTVTDFIFLLTGVNLLWTIRFASVSPCRLWMSYGGSRTSLNLNFMVVLAKNMKDMWWGFDALGALVERWHPHTHTFVFQAFEVSVLLEEVELFLGWRRCLEYDAATPLLPWEEILTDIVRDKKELLRMTNKNGIFLDRLAWWLIQHAKEIGGEWAMRGLTLCLAVVFLFPTSGNFILYEHVGVLCLQWRGQSLAPAVLAHLEDRDLWLIGADQMVVYQPHRWHCRLGIPRGIPNSSNCTDMIVTGRNEKLMKKAMKIWARYTVSKKVGLAVQENWEEIWKYEEFNDGICPTACDFFMARRAK